MCKQTIDKYQDGQIVQGRDIRNPRVVNMISHDAQANNDTTNTVLEGALLQKVAVTDQLVRDLDDSEGGVALEYMPHDWQDLGFDQRFALVWHNGGSQQTLTADLFVYDLPNCVQGKPGFPTNFKAENLPW